MPLAIPGHLNSKYKGVGLIGSRLDSECEARGPSPNDVKVKWSNERVYLKPLVFDYAAQIHVCGWTDRAKGRKNGLMPPTERDIADPRNVILTACIRFFNS